MPTKWGLSGNKRSTTAVIYFMRLLVLPSLITDDSHAVTCHKGLWCGRPETRIKVKSSTSLPVAPRLQSTTNLQKLIIPTDETPRPIAKTSHKQLSFAATAELFQRHFSRYLCDFKTVSPTFTAPTQCDAGGFAVCSLHPPALFHYFLALS